MVRAALHRFAPLTCLVSSLALPLASSLGGCGGDDAPTLSCPKGHVAAWVDKANGVAECQADLPLRNGGAPVKRPLT